MNRKTVRIQNYFKLIIISLLIGLISSLLAFSLKHLTEHVEQTIFSLAKSVNPILFIILPSIGITAIYFLRKYLFHNKSNKGITEILITLDKRKDHLPFYKIPSHYINGFLTIIFGGSTGIEVSTVVATATVGNVAYKKDFSAKMYKRELVCAGIAAGVSVLFGSPIVGWLFAMEVIAKKISKTTIISCTSSAIVAWAFIYFFDGEPLLPFKAEGWKWSAIPFFILLSVFGGVLSVYFTILVIRIKEFFSNISNNFLRVNLGALIVGTSIFFLPFLYGDSYHGLKQILNQAIIHHTFSLSLIAILVFLKPLMASLTLGAGGDGGVFAPSIVAGAILGLLFATFCNTYFGTHLILLNFALVGAAATLSSAIYAPFTALILVCNLVPNGYVLFLPILLGSCISNYFSKFLLPYNVYTYNLNSSYSTKNPSKV